MLPNYPYTDFHRLNADWILEKTKEAAALVEGAESRFAALESDVASLQQGLGIVEQQVSGHEEWLQNLEGRMDAAESDIDNLEADVDALDGRLDTADSDIETLQQGLGIVEQQVGGHEDWLLNLDGRMDTAENDIDNLETNVDSLDAQVESIDNDIADLQNLMDSISTLHVIFSGDSTASPSTAACNKTWEQIYAWFHTQGKPVMLWYRLTPTTVYQLGSVMLGSTAISGSCYIPEDPTDPTNAFVLVTCFLDDVGTVRCLYNEV